MEDPQAEFWDYGYDVVEDVGLDGFVLGPRLFFAEDVDLDWEPLPCRLELPYQKRHVGVDHGVVLKVSDYVGSECPDIGQTATVDQFRLVYGNVFIGFFQLFKFPVYVFRDVFYLSELVDHLLIADFYRGHVDVDGALDSPASRFFHASPVFERTGDEGVSGNRGNGLVEIPYHDRCQGHVDNVAVGAEIGDLDPVADTHHLVGGELYSRDETENGIPEDQDQNSSYGAKASEKEIGRFSHDDGKNDDDRSRIQDDLGHLDKSPEGHSSRYVECSIDIKSGVQEGVDHHESGDDQVHGGKFPKKSNAAGKFFQNDR